MKSVRTTRTASRAGSGKARIIRNPLGQLVTDAECSVDAIHRRACHVGPTMEGILHELEEHGLATQAMGV